MSGTRTEKDSFGPIDVPADRLWGAQTERSRRFFRISSERMPLPVVHALARVASFLADPSRSILRTLRIMLTTNHLGTDAALLEPLRALRPELDTCSFVPPSALGHLHMDFEHPEARLADDGLVGELPAAAIDDLLAVAGVGGPKSQSPLTTVELRHASGALETLERGFFTHAAGTPTDAASAAAIEAQLALVAGALAPYGAVTL